MRLVAESGGKRDVCQRTNAGRNRVTRPLKSQISHKLSHREAKDGFELLTHVGGMKVVDLGKLRQRRRRSKLRYQILSDFIQPTLPDRFCGGTRASCACQLELQQQAFERKCRDSVSIFPRLMDPIQYSRDNPTREHAWRGKKIVQYFQIELRLRDGLYQETGSGYWAVAIRMIRTRGFRQNAAGRAEEFLPRKYLLKASSDDKRPARKRVFVFRHLLARRIR